MNKRSYKKKNLKIFFIFIFSRIIKIVANLLKLASYIFHYIFPDKRFTIPRNRKPLLNIKSKRKIKKIIWQTNFTNRVTLPVYLNYLFNRLMSFDYYYRFMDNEACMKFVKSNYPKEIFNTYSRIKIGAAHADFWRILVLYKHGGVYLDMDAHLVWPLSSLIHPDDTSLYIVIKKEEISNYFIASSENNKNLKCLIDLTLKNVEENSIKNIYDLTGPGIFNKILDVNKENTAYYRYICNQGNFTNEHFQYIDKAEGKWTREQEKTDIIK